MLDYIKRFRIVQLYVTYVLVFGCIVCTIGQILLLPIKLIHPKLFYFFNEKLQYCYFCLVPFGVENWGGYKIQVYGQEGIFEIFKDSKDRNMLVVMNHTGEVDWMIGWSVIEKIGMLGIIKTMIKDMVKYVPIFGWSFYISDYIFVKRSAQTDLPLISKACEMYKNYPYKFVMSIFPEGTRFTEEKHAKSLEYAAAKGLPQYKYHLLPRAKGFYHLVMMMKANVNSKYVFDVQYAYRGKQATTLGILSGEQGWCDVHMSCIPLSEVPNDEAGFSKWLYQLFEEKDRLMDHHKRHNEFPGELLDQGEGYWRSKCALWWAVTSTFPILYTVWCLVMSGHWLYLSLLVGTIPVASWVFRLLVGLTESKHGSTYGLSNSSVKKQD